MDLAQSGITQPLDITFTALGEVILGNGLDTGSKLLPDTCQNMDNALLSDFQVNQSQRRDLTVGGLATGNSCLKLGSLLLKTLLFSLVAGNALIILSRSAPP
jgi:hypothetical protein